MVDRLQLVVPTLPRNASAEDRERGYANLALQLTAKVREMDNTIIDTEAAAIAASGAAHRAEAKVAATHERLEGLIKEFGTIKEALSYFTTFLDKVKERAEQIAAKTATDVSEKTVEEHTGRYHTVLFHAAMDAAAITNAAKGTAPGGSVPPGKVEATVTAVLEKQELASVRQTRETWRQVFILVVGGAGGVGLWELAKYLAHHS